MRKKLALIIAFGLLLLIQPIIAQTWEKTKRLTWNAGDSRDPAIAIDSSNNIHAVWGDFAPGNYEIYYIKSTDGGATWTTNRLTWTSGNSRRPAIAVDANNHIHLAWQDLTPGNYEIYYRKGVQ